MWRWSRLLWMSETANAVNSADLADPKEFESRQESNAFHNLLQHQGKCLRLLSPSPIGSLQSSNWSLSITISQEKASAKFVVYLATPNRLLWWGMKRPFSQIQRGALILSFVFRNMQFNTTAFDLILFKEEVRRSCLHLSLEVFIPTPTMIPFHIVD